MDEPIPGFPFDLADLAKTDHEPLVVLAVELEFCPARMALFVKCEDVKNSHVWLLARRRGWCDADISDAEQEAVDWVTAAIDSYDTSQIGKPNGCGFCSHLFRVIDRRFKNYVRNRKRREQHLDRRVEVNESLDADRLHRHRGLGYSFGDDAGLTDPAAIAEHHEEMQLLEQAVRERDAIDQRIFALHFFDRLSEPEAAAQLGLTPAVVQHRWRKMLKELKARFADREMPTRVKSLR